MITIKPILLLALLAIFVSSKAQDSKRICFEKIKQKRIRLFMQQQHWFNSDDFAQIHSECINKEEKNDYFIHQKTFLIQAPVNEVWQTYLNIQPDDAWKGDLVSFGAMYSDDKVPFHYLHETSPVSAVGQIIFINLRIFGGIFNLPVAHKIAEINEKEHLIRTCYVASGKSKGTQFIRIVADGNGQSKVIHTTYYKSDSDFRDKKIYPFFHSKVITEFHRNISHFILTKKRKPAPDLNPKLTHVNYF